MTVLKSLVSAFLLGMGNRKLGEVIFTFTLPAVKTCPGRSKLCEKVCYALRGHLRMVLDAGHYDPKYQASLGDDFVERMIREIRFRQCQIVRLHVAGDFYSAEYVRKWIAIVTACPNVRFFVYTRSWRVAEIRPDINKLARLKNIRVWFSCDRDTGIPTKVGKRVRIAYMSDGDDDIPSRTPDLGFRVKRKSVMKRLNGASVCPMENGTEAKNNTNCQKCGLCWEDLESKDPRRFALPMAG